MYNGTDFLVTVWTRLSLNSKQSYYPSQKPPEIRCHVYIKSYTQTCNDSPKMKEPKCLPTKNRKKMQSMQKGTALAERTDMLHHGSDRECTEYKMWRQKEDQWLLMNVGRVDKHREDSQGAQSFIQGKQNVLLVEIIV